MFQVSELCDMNMDQVELVLKLAGASSRFLEQRTRPAIDLVRRSIVPGLATQRVVTP